MPRIKSQGSSEKYAAIRADAASAGIMETNDCTVVAVAAACGVPYAAAHAAMKAAGRKDRRGARVHQYRAAVEALGFNFTEFSRADLIKTYPAPHNKLRFVTSHHPERFAKVWPKGVFMISTGRHIWTVVDGVNCDWSKGKALRGRNTYRITKKVFERDANGALVRITNEGHNAI